MNTNLKAAATALESINKPKPINEPVEDPKRLSRRKNY